MRIETSAAKHSKVLNGQKDKLIDDIRSVVADADNLLFPNSLPVQLDCG